MPSNSKDQRGAPDNVTEMQRALNRVLKSLVFVGGPPSALAELPVSQLRCWYHIAEHEGLKMQEVSNALGIKLPALSQMVERLVRRDLISRKTDPQDRRVVRLHLTDVTRTMHIEAKAAHTARLAETSSHLSPQTVEQIIDGLNQLADAAEAVESCGRPDADCKEATDRFANLTAKRADIARKIGATELSPSGISGSPTHG